MYTYFLSDIHMGLNRSENWYQQYVHQRLVQNALLYIQNKGTAVDDVVVLGDWFDTWEYCSEGPLPAPDSKTAVGQIIDSNIDLFTQGSSGDFISCLNTIGGNMWYVNGNHDMTIDCEDINDTLRLSGKKIYTPENSMVYLSKDNLIYAEHGHRYSLTCDNDDHDGNKIAPIPIGYFVSRTGSSYCLGELNGKKSSAELPYSGVPSLKDLWGKTTTSDEFKKADNGLTFANIFLTAVISQLGKSTTDHYTFLMPDGSVLTGSEAVDLYSWIPLKAAASLNFLEADVNNNLDGFAQRCSNGEYKLVVFGHTHVPKILPTNLGSAGTGLYANSGYLCADIPGMEDSSGKGRYMTFCEVERQPGRLTVRILKVDYDTGTVAQLGDMSNSVDI